MGKVIQTHRSRIEDCLSGAKPDRPPVALWRHFPVDDQSPGALAKAVTHFQKDYDFDLVKVTPASSYCLKDWGIEDIWTGNAEGTRDYTNFVIHTPEDWLRLQVLNPRRGVYGDHIQSLRLIHKELGEDTPLLQTIFNPLAQAKHLCGPELLLKHIKEEPGALKSGLKTITDTTIRFIQEAAGTGISGIFYAVQHAQEGLLTQEEYLSFGKEFDDQILGAAKEFWINVLHLHGSNVYFDLLADYQAQVINWHDRDTSYSLKDAKDHTSAAVCGGLRQWKTLALGTPDDIIREGRDAMEQTSGQRFILGTGCVLPIIAPHGNILAARTLVES